MTTTSKIPAIAQGRQNWPSMLDIAVREVFELMLSCKLEAPKPVRDDAVQDMTAMVGLAGQLCGVISIRCNRNAARLMASRMLGVEKDKVGPELCDAFGEICNMIAGNFKNKIPGLGDGCMLSVPTVITGNDYSMTSMTDLDAVEVQLLFESMRITVSLQVHS